MAFEFKFTAEEYAEVITPEMLKSAFEEYGFEVELNETVVIENTTFKSISYQDMLTSINQESSKPLSINLSHRITKTMSIFKNATIISGLGYYNESLGEYSFKILPSAKNIRTQSRFNASSNIKPILITHMCEDEIDNYHQLSTKQVLSLGAV